MPFAEAYLSKKYRIEESELQTGTSKGSRSGGHGGNDGPDFSTSRWEKGNVAFHSVPGGDPAIGKGKPLDSRASSDESTLS